MKTRVISRKQQMDPAVAEWVANLRESDKSRKVYAVNPFAEVYCFRKNIYSIYTECADGIGEPWIHLIIGPEKAMVIDTAFGIGNLKGLVDELTGGMPLIAFNTHPHIDHSGGNHQFDRVYCHKYSVPELQERLTPHNWDHLFDANGKGIWIRIDKKDLVPFKKYEIIGCENNHIFDLGGGHKIELIWAPGHAPGVGLLLDKKNRILFSDDTLSRGGINILVPRPNMAYKEFIRVTCLRDELAKLAPRSDEFDTLWPQHGILGLDKGLVQSMLDACNAIVADPNSYDSTGLVYTGKHLNGIELRMKKLMTGRLAYEPTCV